MGNVTRGTWPRQHLVSELRLLGRESQSRRRKHTTHTSGPHSNNGEMLLNAGRLSCSGFLIFFPCGQVLRAGLAFET